MGRPRTRREKSHAPSPDGLGLICGLPRRGAIIASLPRVVSCQTCRSYIDRHPDEFPPEKFLG